MQELLRVVFPGLLALCLSGCYYLHLAGGQMRLLLKREPIAEVLADPATDPELKARLQLALEARRFASEELDLPRNDSYTLYADIGRPSVMFNVYATPALSLKPVTHCFPIAGCVAYQGFYSRTRAQAAAARQRAAGNDVYVAGVVAYSTLGHFADPVLPGMLRWGPDELVGTIFHELAHQKFYLPGATRFNESFASFVQHQGLAAWHQAHGTTVSDPLARQRHQQFVQLVLHTRAALEKVYRSALNTASKQARKNAIFTGMRQRYQDLQANQWHGKGDHDHWVEGPPNNAKLVPFGLYNISEPAFEALFQHCHRHWPRFYAAVKKIGRETLSDRQAFLAGTDMPDCG